MQVGFVMYLLSLSLYTIIPLPWLISKLSSQVANGLAFDVSTHTGNYTQGHNTVHPYFHYLSCSLFSLSIFILSLPKSPDSSQPFPYSNTHFRSSRPCPVHAIVEMSSATFACILTGRDGADARYLPNSPIHQLSLGRSEQERGWWNEKRWKESENIIQVTKD